MWHLRVVRPLVPAAVLGLLLSTVLLAQTAPNAPLNATAASAVGQAVPAIPLRPIAELRELALKATPPVEKLEFRKPLLIELGTAKDDPIHLDIHYATANNFLGTPVYTEARAFLQVPAAMALGRVAEKLKKQGYGLVIFDGYRPWFVTKIFWDATPPALHEYVADPAEGSRHNRGCAVDLTLYDLKTGQPVSMPSGYDEMTERAHSNYSGGTEEEREHRKVLREAMLSEGFEPIPNEWWHYDYKEWIEYPVLNLPFDRLPVVAQSIYKLGQGMTPPRIIKRVEPEFSEEAREARVEGAALLKLVVNTNGIPEQVELVKDPGYGLGQKAVEAVRKWRFTPGMKDGNPVSFELMAQVNFHLFPGGRMSLPAEIKEKDKISEPVLLHKGDTRYVPVPSATPQLALVELQLTVAKDGSVKDVRVTRSPNEATAEAVVAAVRQWQYKPATKKGKPVEVRLTVHMSASGD